ncbi:HTH DNA binding protein [Mycobacterium phage Benvolio]|uniref:Helix-turn-helix DNA-binding domain protein n=1 Tax=Mycobacterium phage Benvolio TaxID=2591074 RepID=A0A514A3P9_9CAUD|nr:HTH DNA binding protein [Mycobacterium phage Benvolio]QDH47862.1 helix-turn-helix DNA-binding domain protein [Mycobacterium phage Benvolio]
MKYVTKKQLRLANFELATELGNTKAELADVKAHRDVLDSENGRLIRSNQSLAQTATAYARANRDLRNQLDTAKRAFGEAFVKGEPEAPRGPSRPNRKKLSTADAKDIRNAFYGGAKQKDLARNYGVNPATISRVVRGIYH